MLQRHNPQANTSNCEPLSSHPPVSNRHHPKHASPLGFNPSSSPAPISTLSGLNSMANSKENKVQLNGRLSLSQPQLIAVPPLNKVLINDDVANVLRRYFHHILLMLYCRTLSNKCNIARASCYAWTMVEGFY
jgi:hypothetical protein